MQTKQFLQFLKTTISTSLRRRLMGMNVVVFVLLLMAGIALASNVVELCFDSLGAGQNVTGNYPGSGGDRTFFAGVFNVRVDNQAQYAFCTDINNGISTGCYSNSTVGTTDSKVACTLQYYPPGNPLTNDEASARQAAVWHFSDGYTLVSPAGLLSRWNAIINDINTKYNNGQCGAVQVPTISIDPPSAVNTLESQGQSYKQSPHEYTITVLNSGHPVANQSVTVTTDLGKFVPSNNTSATVTTDASGQAQVTVSHNAVGTATILAKTTMTLPAGTQIDPGTTRQKLVLSGNREVEIEVSATKTWVEGGTITVMKFHDQNRNGVQDSGEPLIDWRYTYKELPSGNTSNYISLGSDGIRTQTVTKNKSYLFCEEEKMGWVRTYPIASNCVEAKDGDTVVFGNADLPSLLIRKFGDKNGNGEWDNDEYGLNGWGFQVFRYEDNTWKLTYSGITVVAGLLAFDNTSFFNFRIDENIQNGWYASTGDSQQVNIQKEDNNQLYTVDFGNLQPGQLTINKEWYFGNQSQNPPATPAQFCIKRTGPGTPSHNLIPTNGSGTALTADGNGYYCQSVSTNATWKNLWPGTYDILETAPTGWTAPAIADATLMSGESKSITVRNQQKDVHPECPTGTQLIAKFNFQGGQYVFEKPAGHDSIVSITNGTATGGNFSSSTLISHVIIKGGPGFYTDIHNPAVGSGSFSNVNLPPVGQGNTPDISNLQFCGSGAPVPGKVIVTKEIVGDATSTFEICVNNECKNFNGDGSQQEWTLNPGNYTVHENEAGAQWNEPADQQVTVVSGQTSNVTVTNTYVEQPKPELSVVGECREGKGGVFIVTNTGDPMPAPQDYYIDGQLVDSFQLGTNESKEIEVGYGEHSFSSGDLEARTNCEEPIVPVLTVVGECREGKGGVFIVTNTGDPMPAPQDYYIDGQLVDSFQLGTNESKEIEVGYGEHSFSSGDLEARTNCEEPIVPMLSVVGECRQSQGGVFIVTNTGDAMPAPQDYSINGNVVGSFQLAKGESKEIGVGYGDYIFSSGDLYAETHCSPPPVCQPDPDRDLRNSLTYIYDANKQILTIKGQIHNISDICWYKVGLASYKKFNDNIEEQELIDHETGTVNPGETIVFEVDICPCHVQVDLFYFSDKGQGGEGVITSFANGKRYGKRLLAYKHVWFPNFCERKVEEEEIQSLSVEPLVEETPDPLVEEEQPPVEETSESPVTDETPVDEDENGETEEQSDETPVDEGENGETEEQSDETPVDEGENGETEEQSDETPVDEGENGETEEQSDETPVDEGENGETEEQSDETPAEEGENGETEEQSNETPAEETGEDE